MAQTFTPLSHQIRSEQIHYQRDGLLCALLMGACFFIAYPFAEMGFIDDWSYVKTAQAFAQTGHFAFNGWATATLGWQVLWGALFSKLLGFSFIHVRLSTLPVAAATIYIFHQILIRFGISRGNAVFGALALGLSPIFLAMSASYMTDISGLFCILLCLYLCQLALSARTNHTAMAWLTLAVFTNVIGGTARQAAWLGTLLLVPSAVWLLRKRTRLFWSAALVWLIGAASVYLSMQWFNHQPYFLPAAPLPHGFLRALLHKRTISMEVRAFFCLLLMVFPVLAAWWSLTRSIPKRLILSLSILVSLLVTVCLVYVYRTGGLEAWTAPWLIHVFGSMGTGALGDIPGPKPFTFGYPMRMFFSVIVLATGFLFFPHLYISLRRGASPKSCSNPFSWREMLFLLIPFALGYTGALISRGIDVDIFDRYLLPLQAIMIICLLRYYQEFAEPESQQPSSLLTAGRSSVVSHMALLALAYYGIAGTHDWFALCRARVEASNEILRSGVPRTAIQGGFEYDGWTQIQDGGYVNDYRIRIPADAYHPVIESKRLPEECTTPSWPSTLCPRVDPQYYLVFAPMHCFASSPFSPVTYYTWMPPFVRKIYVQQRKD